MSAGQVLRDSSATLTRRPRRGKRREREPFCYLRCAGRFSAQVHAPIPGLLPHQLLHTTRERASRGKHVRFLQPEARRLPPNRAIKARAKRAAFTCTPLTTHPLTVLRRTSPDHREA